MADETAPQFEQPSKPDIGVCESVTLALHALADAALADLAANPKLRSQTAVRRAYAVKEIADGASHGFAQLQAKQAQEAANQE